jgi:predicted nucleic acid-binding Zn ribbon protein
MPFRDGDFEDLDPREFPELDAEQDGAATIPCPYCSEPVHEEAQFCPRCENFISREDAPLRKPLWIVVTVLVCLAIVLYWIWSGI